MLLRLSSAHAARAWRRSPQFGYEQASPFLPHCSFTTGPYFNTLWSMYHPMLATDKVALRTHNRADGCEHLSKFPPAAPVRIRRQLFSGWLQRLRGDTPLLTNGYPGWVRRRFRPRQRFCALPTGSAATLLYSPTGARDGCGGGSGLASASVRCQPPPRDHAPVVCRSTNTD